MRVAGATRITPSKIFVPSTSSHQPRSQGTRMRPQKEKTYLGMVMGSTTPPWAAATKVTQVQTEMRTPR